MKNLKKILALLIVAVMTVSMLSACGKSESSNEVNENTEGSENITEAVVTEPAEQEDMAEITVMIMSLGAMGDGKNAVEDGINAITEKEINTHVTLSYVEVGAYSQQLSLAITGNEKVDLCLSTPIPASNFTTLISQNQLVPLNDLLTEYAPETLSLLGDYVKGTTVNGNIYAVPNYRDLSSSYYILARKDIIDSYGLTETFNNMATWSDYEEILKAITDKGELAAISNSDLEGTVYTMTNAWMDSDNFADFTTWDNLGDGYKIISTTEDGKVVNFFESEKYKAEIDRVNSWYTKGYVYKDASMTEETGDNLLKSNVTASIIKTGELGVETELKSSSGYDIVSKKLLTLPITTSTTTKFDWAVPVCATEKEAAVKFLNLMYTNKDICNLLVWGVEGRDYVVDNGVAKYPEGVSADNVQYHSSDFLWGNQFLCYPWDGDAANFREEQMADFASAAISPYLGFSCDTSKISNELTAISNVIAEYKPGLESGVLGTSDYEKFIEKLKDAGVDTVVAEYQTQLDAWKAQK